MKTITRKWLRPAALLMVCVTIGCSMVRPASETTLSQKELVYVLHGLGRTKSAMWLLASRIEDAGFSVKLIGYPTLYQYPEKILENVSGQIDKSLPKDGQTVHFVGHSLGGLMIRAYLDKAVVGNIGRVVLIGTPNKGTGFVEKYRDNWWMGLLGPLPRTLGTNDSSFPNSIGNPYYPVGVIAGVRNMSEGDTGFSGGGDGVVPLESTRLDGMTDMIVLETGHSMMRYDKEVADQTIQFLKQGRFEKGQ